MLDPYQCWSKNTQDMVVLYALGDEFMAAHRISQAIAVETVDLKMGTVGPILQRLHTNGYADRKDGQFRITVKGYARRKELREMEMVARRAVDEIVGGMGT